MMNLCCMWTPSHEDEPMECETADASGATPTEVQVGNHRRARDSRKKTQFRRKNKHSFQPYPKQSSSRKKKTKASYTQFDNEYHTEAYLPASSSRDAPAGVHGAQRYGESIGAEAAYDSLCASSQGKSRARESAPAAVHGTERSGGVTDSEERLKKYAEYPPKDFNQQSDHIPTLQSQNEPIKPSEYGTRNQEPGKEINNSYHVDAYLSQGQNIGTGAAYVSSQHSSHGTQYTRHPSLPGTHYPRQGDLEEGQRDNLDQLSHPRTQPQSRNDHEEGHRDNHRGASLSRTQHTSRNDHEEGYMDNQRRPSHPQHMDNQRSQYHDQQSSWGNTNIGTGAAYVSSQHSSHGTQYTRNPSPPGTHYPRRGDHDEGQRNNLEPLSHPRTQPQSLNDHEEGHRDKQRRSSLPRQQHTSRNDHEERYRDKQRRSSLSRQQHTSRNDHEEGHMDKQRGASLPRTHDQSLQEQRNYLTQPSHPQHMDNQRSQYHDQQSSWGVLTKILPWSNKGSTNVTKFAENRKSASHKDRRSSSLSRIREPQEQERRQSLSYDQHQNQNFINSYSENSELHNQGIFHQGSTSQGLPNIGNTCYMNCVLQCLYHTPEFTQHLTSAKLHINKDAPSQGEVTKTYIDLIRDMGEGKDLRSTLKYLKSIIEKNDSLFRGTGQKEAHDFLASVLLWFYEELAKGTCTSGIWRYCDVKDSIVTDLFYGIQSSTFFCEKEKKRSIFGSYEPFSNLSLAVTSTSHTSLEEILERHYESQMVMWKCHLCEEDHEVRHERKIVYLPTVLILHLSRFNNDTRMGSWRKAEINFPLKNLSLDAHKAHDAKSRTYDLYATCNHRGSMNGGHYTAFCQESNKRWTKYSDSFTSKTDPSRIPRDEAHILFYRAVDG